MKTGRDSNKMKTIVTLSEAKGLILRRERHLHSRRGAVQVCFAPLSMTFC